MLVDGIKVESTNEQCENVKNVVSKYGVNVVCDEEETIHADVRMQASEVCEEVKEVASKYGTTVVCE